MPNLVKRRIQLLACAGRVGNGEEREREERCGFGLVERRGGGRGRGERVAGVIG